MRLTIEKVSILRKVEIFANTPDYVLASVAAAVEEVNLDSGSTFIKKGEVEDCMYIVIDGEVRVYDGEKTIARLGPGQSVGEMAVLDPSPRAVSVMATQDTNLFRLNKEALDELMGDRPEIAQSVIQMLCRRLRAVIS